jgi:hypothetical protein
LIAKFDIYDTADIKRINDLFAQAFLQHQPKKYIPFHCSRRKKTRRKPYKIFKPSRDAIPSMRHGDGMSAAQQRKVDALSAQEHAANAKTLQFNEKDFRDDLRKAILKHAEREYGITDTAEYLEQARKTVASADHVSVRDYKGGLQYSFLSTKEKGYAVVDMNLQLRGCYGHVKEGAIEKCLRENLEKYQTMIMF